MWKQGSLWLIGLLVACAATAGEQYKSRLFDSGLGMAAVAGAADYCSDGQPLLDLFVGSLPHFGLAAADVDTLLAAMQTRRQQTYADISASLTRAGGVRGRCPAEVNDKVNGALRGLEEAWRRALKSEFGVVLPALSVSSVASSPSGAGGVPPAAAVVPAPQFASAQDKAAPHSQTVPPGKYSCYTFDAGQLNYSYTDILIVAGGRYSVGKQGGNYTLSADGAMRFSGHLANASGRFAIKSSGKPQIDLVFNGDQRASMACMKSA